MRPIGPIGVNRYTIVMDVLFPAESLGKRIALLDLDLGQFESPFSSAEYMVQANNRVGAGNGGFGNLEANTWYRIAFSVDLSRSSDDLVVLINGVRVGTQTLGDIDVAPWFLFDELWMFSDDNGETEVVFINSLQIWDEALEDDFIAAMGGPSVEGIPSTPPEHPFLRSLAPSPSTARFPARSTISPLPDIVVEIRDGQATVDEASIEVRLNDEVIAHSTEKVDDVSTVTSLVPNALETLSVNSVTLTYSDSGGTEQTIEWKFAVGPFVGLPSGVAGPVGSGENPGFLVTNYQSTDLIILPRTFERALSQINGTIVDPLSGESLPNLAFTGDNDDGSITYGSQRSIPGR